jgi:outer membrane protein TolC
MRRRRRRSWLLPLTLGAGMLASRGASGQVQRPPTPDDRPQTPPILPPALPVTAPPPGTPAATLSSLLIPPAPEPLPGPASSGLPRGGRSVPTPGGLPINLATALQLAGVRPLDIAAATAQVEQALGLQLQARALWIPNINGGIDYFRHDGVQQNIFTGENFRKGRQTFFVAGGPSLSVGLTDAIFAPLAARRVVASREADVQAARNDVLLQVTRAFFDLQASRGRLLGIDASIARAELLVNFARGLAPSLIPPLEINRAVTELQTLLQTQQVAIRDWRVASARLAEVLLLDPSTLLEPVEPPFLQVTLIPCEETPENLVPIAVRNRPEIASRRELVAAAEMLLSREKSRPFLPYLFVISPAAANGQLGAGNYASGPNGVLNSNGSRFDIELSAVWQLQNGGVGNLGLVRQRRGERDLASVEFTRTVYRVRSEVAQALARLQTARMRVVETEEGVRQSVESADKNFIGLRETARPAGELLRLIVRPQEVVQAIAAMETAYEQYAFAIGEYNTAQFDLYRALGQPAQWVTSLRLNPGPPISPGPPPADRPPPR